ncbi:hypothetical protein PHMEG_00015212 [Phytophthora megakarya]|uniref:Uncharacterized protein n=1 Tax=Phytophthora megakarya TaxID=4795 RepID=A0A225W2C1_9STRA|nr:hypothetical protein PHMEG_00015212 [Phytophthora megakarya]
MVSSGTEQDRRSATRHAVSRTSSDDKGTSYYDFQRLFKVLRPYSKVVGIGVPELPRNLMIDLLGPGIIDVRKAFGWLSTGEREFGIGQGSILSILHISCYMDCLQARLAECADPNEIQHHQTGGRRVSIGSTLFVDDQLDITSTEQRAQERAKITNMFTGKTGTGGAFGASKSYMMYLTHGNEHFQDVSLNDGMGIPRQVQVVSPSKGFKHVGIYQCGDDLWEATVPPVWQQISEEAERIQCQRLTLHQFRYVVSSVWVPRLRYRMILGGAIRSSGLFDTFIRQVARSVLRLPHSSPRSIYYDQVNRIGLLSCELDANVHRYQEALRILNTPELLVHHALVESLEVCQVNAGLTDNPLTIPIKRPIHVTTWMAQVIRFAATMKPPLRCECEWKQPTTACPQRSNDKPLMFITPIALQTGLVATNWNSQFKLHFVGDICTEYGTRLLTQDELFRKGKWKGTKRGKVDTLYDKWKAALTTEGSLMLRDPVGWVKVPVGIVPYQLRIGVGDWIVAVALDTSETEPTLHHHELGHRHIGDVTRGGVRSKETVTFGTSELTDETSRNLKLSAFRDRMILWTDTVVDGVHGVNDREILQEALKRSQLRYESTFLLRVRNVDVIVVHSGVEIVRNGIIPIVFRSIIHVVMQQLVAHGSAIYATRGKRVQTRSQYKQVMVVSCKQTLLLHMGAGLCKQLEDLLLWVNFTFTPKISPLHVVKYMV